MARGSIVAAFAAGGVLASLVWFFGVDGVRAKDRSPDGPIHSDTLQAAPQHATTTNTCPTPPACPTPPTCSSVPTEPSTTKTDLEREREELELSPIDRTADVQAMLSEAMTTANIRASFDLDCTARPCLAVFAGQVPSEEERATVIQRLVETRPSINLTSTTIIGEDGQVSWVLGLADEEPTRDERALVDARVEDLLP